MNDVRHLAGSEFMGWVLGSELGRGDSAIVYEAAQGERSAAIKIFFPEALDKHGRAEEEVRLDLQLQLKGRKHHLNLVEVYEGGVSPECGGTIYIVMEKVPGKTLDAHVGSIPINILPAITRQLADALQYLENLGLAHRDIKPANIIISPDHKVVTILDFGIVIGLQGDGQGRLSGDRFVGTLRYSPPEFVWRSEEESPEALKAITFYQIGATLHDLIMGYRLFNGSDQPTARLYDSIKYHSPVVENKSCPDWLVTLVRSCLVKDWRQRLGLLSWENFRQPEDEHEYLQFRLQSIKLRQIRHEEIINAKNAMVVDIQDQRIRDLWDLQDKLFLETRSFLLNAGVFPKFSSHRDSGDVNKYKFLFRFEIAPTLGFYNSVILEIELKISYETGQAVELSLNSSIEGRAIFTGRWIEGFTVQGASKYVNSALLQIAEKIVPND